jgi:hypothetical protein
MNNIQNRVIQCDEEESGESSIPAKQEVTSANCLDLPATWKVIAPHPCKPPQAATQLPTS